jgi:hypothetical protein
MVQNKKQQFIYAHDLKCEQPNFITSFDYVINNLIMLFFIDIYDDLHTISIALY